MKRYQEPLLQTEETERFTPDICQGLSDEQVNLRIKEKLVNKVSEKFSKSYFSIVKDNLFTFFNLLGLIVCIALAIIGAELSRFFFVVIYLANISIGIIQEIRAKKCIEKLSLMASKTVTTMRNGKEVEILSTDLVLDDIYKLSMGDQVPTDSIILSGDVEVNESLLTGESVPIKKSVGDFLYAGSFIISGTPILRADKVGKENYIEILSSKAKKYKKPHSELMTSLRIIIKSIGAIILPIALAFILKSFIFFDIPVFDIIDGASTVVIGMIPSGMFLLTSVALAVGVIKLARQNTLVQDLYSLEMLARVDTICFDKTGTLTDGQMSVDKTIDIDSSENVNLIMSSMLSAMTSNNQTELALKDFFTQENILAVNSIIQFNSTRKFACASLSDGFTYAYGAPEFILDDNTYITVSEKINDYAKQGFRVILLAKSSTPIINDTPPQDFQPVSLILIIDHVREDAIRTIQWFKDNDVAIKVISGDNPVTVSVIASKAGVENADKYLSLEGLSDEEIIKLANDYTVFGRVSPEQKAVLVKAIKSQGHITAMTGDGVNDILALKEADCAISVGSGSQAAKNISHLVLLDNNFATMPNVVHEGRRVINNVKSSSSLFLMKTMFTIFFSLLMLFMPNAPVYPFSLSQMLLLEFFIIGIASFVLSLQPNDKRVSGTFINSVFLKALPYAILMVFSVCAVHVFKSIYGTTSIITDDVYSTMSANVLNISALICLFHTCRPFNKMKVWLFALTSTAVIGVTIFGLFNGFDMFDLTAMIPYAKEEWLHLLYMGIVIIIDIPLSILFMKLSNKLIEKSIKKKQKVIN